MRITDRKPTPKGFMELSNYLRTLEKKVVGENLLKTLRSFLREVSLKYYITQKGLCDTLKESFIKALGDLKAETNEDNDRIYDFLQSIDRTKLGEKANNALKSALDKLDPNKENKL